MIAAWAASGLLAREAAISPTIMPASASRLWRLLAVTLRAMWRWVTWVSSCASTEASSSAAPVSAIRAKCTPTKPPGSANAFTLRSRTRNASQAKLASMSAVMSPCWRAAATSGCQIDSRYSCSTGSSR